MVAGDAVGHAAEADGAAFVIVVADPFTAEVDVFGPFDQATGDSEVERRRGELDAEGLTDVIVVLVPLNPPSGQA